MCKSCQANVVTYGKYRRVTVHELGCPDSWKDESRSCGWCGSEFKPEHRDQVFCDESCYCAFHGYPDPNDDDLIEEMM